MKTLGLWVVLALLPPPSATAQARDAPLAVIVDYSFESGWPASYIESVKLLRVAFDLGIELSSRGGWRVEYPISVYPLIFARGALLAFRETANSRRATRLGIGAHPIAIRVLRAAGASYLYVGVGAGVTYFNGPIPTRSGTQGNFSADAEGGLRVPLSRSRELVVGYQFNHLSNGGRGDKNPALDSHMLRIGFRGR